VDTTTWQAVDRIAIDPQPSEAFLALANRFLYVLHDRLDIDRQALDMAAKKNSHLSIVDLPSRETVRRVDVGWNVSSMQVTRDKRYLVFHGRGRGDVKPEAAAEVVGGSHGANGSAREPDKKPQYAWLTIVDTQRDNAVTSLRIGPPGTVVIFPTDMSRVFALSPPQLERKNGTRDVVPPSGVPWIYPLPQLRKEKLRAKAALRIFSSGSENPIAVVDLEHWPREMVLSPDEKYLYALDPGVPTTKKSQYQDGSVQVVDVESGKSVRYFSLGITSITLEVSKATGEVLVPGLNSVREKKTRIHRLRGAEPLPALDTALELASLGERLDSLNGRFVVARDQMCFWPDASPALDKCVILNQPKRSEAGRASKELLPRESDLPAKDFNGLPRRFTYLPRIRKLEIADPGADRVGIVDTERHHLESVVTTGRGGVKFGKVFGAMVASAALGAAAGAIANVASGGLYTPVYYPWIGPGLFLPAGFSYEMAIRSDDSKIYALNSFSDDVTIIEVSTGKVVDKIPVGGGAQGIGFTPGEKLLVAQASEQVTFIDAENNRTVLEHKFVGQTASQQTSFEHVNSLVMLRSQPRIVALASKSLVIFDANNASHLTTAKGYSEPYLLIEPEWPLVRRKNPGSAGTVDLC
jgi:YVTN family beta-propeller protein